MIQEEKMFVVCQMSLKVAAFLYGVFFPSSISLCIRSLELCVDKQLFLSKVFFLKLLFFTSLSVKKTMQALECVEQDIGSNLFPFV